MKLMHIITSIFLIILLFKLFPALTVSAEASETVFTNGKAKIDFTDSNTTGTVRINMVSESDKRVKVTISKNEENSQTYAYNLQNNTTAEIYPLQMGDGEYIVKIWFQATGSRYSLGMTGRYSVKLSDVNAPFLNPNQYVNYSDESKITKIAADLTKDCLNELEKVEEIYKFVIHGLEYDMHKADTVQSSYLPSVDAIVDIGKGICFDYAAVFAAMLRSVDVPAKLVTGYVKPDNEYHAWNEFYLKDEGGWFKINEMKFDGRKFERIDPTFDSTSKSSRKVLQFIGDGTNYTKFQEY
ncbi:MAG: transglutaminase-like domain-containing protein [Oscillospiraceae bacterium]|nr:transglutaminase-like domain-containing protein [Oscillospiraceae bacterium]